MRISTILTAEEKDMVNSAIYWRISKRVHLIQKKNRELLDKMEADLVEIENEINRRKGK